VFSCLDFLCIKPLFAGAKKTLVGWGIQQRSFFTTQESFPSLRGREGQVKKAAFNIFSMKLEAKRGLGLDSQEENRDKNCQGMTTFRPMFRLPFLPKRAF